MDKGQRRNKLLTPQENEPSEPYQRLPLTDSSFRHQKLEGLEFPFRWKVIVLIHPSEFFHEIQNIFAFMQKRKLAPKRMLQDQVEKELGYGEIRIHDSPKALKITKPCQSGGLS